MVTLTEFLNARYAEDEAEARPWVEVWGPTSEGPDTDYVWHFHPARVLAEVEAKRRIVENADCYSHAFDDIYDSGAQVAWRTLRLLALPYADHPDYNEGWRPWSPDRRHRLDVTEN